MSAVPPNLFSAFKAIDAVAIKVEGIMLEHYRAAVWAVFQELVYTTPQFSGRAAANWNIGIDAPDFSVDYDLGEQSDVVPAKNGGEKFSSFAPRSVGDPKWAEEALERNKYKVRLIKSNTRVYITNAVQGDSDEANGGSSTYYLADLQNQAYWSQKLRLANMPYETVTQVLMTESWRDLLRIKNPNQNFFQ